VIDRQKGGGITKGVFQMKNKFTTNSIEDDVTYAYTGGADTPIKYDIKKGQHLFTISFSRFAKQ
jgi:hypothetical protein